jgi:hypothetical protein
MSAEKESVQVPRSRHKQVILYRFTVDGTPCIDPGKPHGIGPDGVLANLIQQVGLSLHGRSAPEIRDGAREALADYLHG